MINFQASIFLIWFLKLIKDSNSHLVPLIWQMTKRTLWEINFLNLEWKIVWLSKAVTLVILMRSLQLLTRTLITVQWWNQFWRLWLLCSLKKKLLSIKQQLIFLDLQSTKFQNKYKQQNNYMQRKIRIFQMINWNQIVILKEIFSSQIKWQKFMNLNKF